MVSLAALIDDLVAANRILAAEGVVDTFGHVSVRHPADPGRYLLSRARSPEHVVAEDIMVFSLDGTPIEGRGRQPYGERFIHGALYELRPEVMAVVHSHSRSVVPFSVTGEILKPVMHTCVTIGPEVPIWDPQTGFGDTDMLITNMALGRDLAGFVGQGNSALMRGHGSVNVGRSLREAVYTGIHLEVNATLQMNAARLNKIKFLSPGEIDLCLERLGRGGASMGFERAWENWCNRTGIAYRPAP
jgi:ribulose-5-phosphate 4-epimerase/fuculose-1-phosphate aldolase